MFKHWPGRVCMCGNQDINTIYKTTILHLFTFCNISFSRHIHKQEQAHMHGTHFHLMQCGRWKVTETGGHITLLTEQVGRVCVRVGECRGWGYASGCHVALSKGRWRRCCGRLLRLCEQDASFAAPLSHSSSLHLSFPGADDESSSVTSSAVVVNKSRRSFQVISNSIVKHLCVFSLTSNIQYAEQHN